MSGSVKSDLIEQSIGLLERYAKCLSNDVHLNNNSDTFENLASQVEFYVKSNAIHKKTEEVFNSFTQNLEDMGELDNKEIVKDYKKQLNEELKTIGDPKEDRRYKEFLNSLEEKDSDTSEILTVSESINLIDPISKKPIVDPVKNKNCGHTYEKSTIVELISKNPHLRCPMVGCSVSGIKKSDLVDDPEMRRHIQKQKDTQTVRESMPRIHLDDTAENESCTEEE